jgi:solute carrier family 45 protein 1/2/4
MPQLSSLQLFLLTVCLAGVQFTWTVELAYGTPYLVSLGLSSSLTALVWIAGPLSGLLIQPIVGAYSDQLNWKYGRRKPFIIVGGLLLIFSVCLIAYNSEICLWFFASSSNEFKNLQIGIAVFAFYLLDFSVNAVTCSCRSLIVDVTPLEQQQLANAWGAFQLGVGNIGGYLSGYLDLPAIFPLLGDTQIKVLCLINIIWLTTLLTITLISAKEPIVNNSVDSPSQRRWWEPLNSIFRGIKNLPTDVQKVCNVQLVGWLAWFPFLFYWYSLVI